jgi:hypothetical protein
MTMAASALAIGLRMEPAQSLPLGGKIASPGAMVQQVQGERSDRRDRDRPRDRDRRGDGFYFGFGPGGPSFGYGRQPARGCDWLRRRALETDSAYWWGRYRECRGG